MIWDLIIGLGDSLTSGARDEYRRGYPLELQQMLNEKHKKKFFVVVNEGIVRQTSSDLLNRAYKTLKSYPESALVLLMIGTNDAKERVPVPIFRKNLKELIQLCILFKKRVILATLPSIKGTGLFDYPIGSQWYVDQYNEIIKKFLYNYEVAFVDMTPLNKYRIDKVHFDNMGYKAMAEIWMEAIDKL